MTIAFAGVPLLFDNASGELTRCMERYLTLDDLRLWGVEPLARYNGNLPIPYPNFSTPPAIRLNSLYWPTGASRWAFGLYVVDEVRLRTILSRVGGTNVRARRNIPRQLVIADSEYAGTIAPNKWNLDSSGRALLSTEMYALPPRKLAPNTVSSAGNTIPGPWLLPLVDLRYFWQWKHTGDFDATEVGDWDSVFAKLEEALDIVPGGEIDPPGLTWDAPHEDYGRPDAEWMRRNLSYQNAAVVLDAVAASVGMRFARWISRRAKIMDAISANLKFLNTGLPIGFGAGESFQTLFGGTFDEQHRASVIPEFVTVVFTDPCDNTKQVVEEAASDHGFNDFSAGFRQVIHVVGRDPFPGGETSTSLASEKSDLAFRVAQDYYDWLTRRYDLSFHAVKVWDPTGFDDFVIWDFASQDSFGQYRCQTRVHSMPYNFGVDSVLQSESTGDFDECFVEGELLTHLRKASDPRDGATVFSMRPFVQGQEAGMPLDLSEHAESLTGVNRSVDLEAPPGTYLVCRWIGRELRPLWVDCGPTSGSSTTWGA